MPGISVIPISFPPQSLFPPLPLPPPFTGALDEGLNPFSVGQSWGRNHCITETSGARVSDMSGVRVRYWTRCQPPEDKMEVCTCGIFAISLSGVSSASWRVVTALSGERVIFPLRFPPFDCSVPYSSPCGRGDYAHSSILTVVFVHHTAVEARIIRADTKRRVTTRLKSTFELSDLGTSSPPTILGSHYPQ